MNDYPKGANRGYIAGVTVAGACGGSGYGMNSHAQEQSKQAYSQPQSTQLRESELPEQLRRLENAVDLLGVPVAELGAHLAPVLQPERESNSAVAPSAAPPTTGYAAMVYTQVLRLEHLCGRLQDILRRSEV